MNLEKINLPIKYIWKNTRESIFKEKLEGLEQYKMQIHDKNLKELKKEKIDCEIRLCNNKSLSQYIFQIVSISLSVFALIASVGYGIVNDATGMIGYSRFINQRYKLFENANKNISNINSQVIKNKAFGKEKAYLELNNLLFEFTQSSNSIAMDICSNNEAYRKYTDSFDKMVIKINRNIKWKKYRDKVSRSKKYILDMGNVNKDFTVSMTKIKYINKFYNTLGLICLGLLLFYIVLIYFLIGFDDYNAKNEYISGKRLEIINELINIRMKGTEREELVYNPKTESSVIKIIRKMLNLPKSRNKVG